VTTRADARAEATARLRLVADPTASLDADLLLAHVCGITREALYAHMDEHMSPSEALALHDLVERRARGEPVAYLRGYKEFYGLRLAVDPRVLIPRPETEVLVEAVLEQVRATGRTRVVDVGTGSGGIAIAVAVSDPRVRVIATDVSADALAVARANAIAHGVARRIDLRQGDLLTPVTEPVDVVAANLPYLRADAREHLTGERTSLLFEPAVAVVAGEDGLDLIRRCVAQLRDKLAPEGVALLECDPSQASVVADLLRDTIHATTRVLPDLTGAPRVVEGKSGW